MENYENSQSATMTTSEDQYVAEPTKNEIFSCHMCNKIFTTKSNLKKHLLIHGGKKPYSCCVCSKRFTEKSNLIIHFRKHSGIFPHKCLICNKGFNRKKSLEKHQIQYHTATFLCTICNKEFFRSNDLLSHQLIHNNDDKQLPFCEICQKCFANRANLKVHSRIHLNELPYTCSYCGKRFRQNHVLKTHILIHTGERPYSCTICHKRFSSRGALKTHCLVHLKRYVCNICDMKFPNCDALNRHSLLHTGVFPFICKVCSKGFVNNRLLKKHEIIHYNDRPFTCNFCEKKFKHKGNLTSHRLMHLCSAHFVCETCGKDFVYKNNFKRHLQVHNNERPFICDICDARFTAKHSLKIHCLRHSNNAPTYKCETCGQSFRARSSLNYHNLKHLSNLLNQKKSIVSLNNSNLQNVSDCVKSHGEHDNFSFQSNSDNNQSLYTLKPNSNVLNNLLINDKSSLTVCNTTLQYKPIEEKLKQYPKIAPMPAKLSSASPPISNETNSNLIPSLTNTTTTPKINNPLIIYSDAKIPSTIFIINESFDRHKCLICEKVFKNEKLLAQHNLIHTKDRPHVCEICLQSFTAKSSLKRHLQRHTNQPLFQCSTCLKKFFQLGNLKIHQNKCTFKQNVHDDINNISKDENNESIMNTNLEIYDNRTHINSSENAFKENVDQTSKEDDENLLQQNCMSTNNSTSTMKENIDISNEKDNGNVVVRRNWRCERCNKNFKLYTLWKIHKCISDQIICDEYVNQCQILCADIKNFSKGKIIEQEENTSITHIEDSVKNIYLNKFIKSCSVCGANFSTDNILQKHVTTVHSSEAFYKCFCGMKLKNKLTLRAHRLTHVFNDFA